VAEKELVTMHHKDNPLDGSNSLWVRRGRVESVDLYEIKDSELDELEKGSPAELQLNFAIFLVSTAFAAVSSLFTATFAYSAIQTTYIVISVVGILGGAYLLLAWWRARRAIKSLCRRIRERIPPDIMASLQDEQEDDFSTMEDPDVAPPPKG
jgi:hypothetical protein